MIVGLCFVLENIQTCLDGETDSYHHGDRCPDHNGPVEASTSIGIAIRSTVVILVPDLAYLEP